MQVQRMKIKRSESVSVGNVFPSCGEAVVASQIVGSSIAALGHVKHAASYAVAPKLLKNNSAKALEKKPPIQVDGNKITLSLKAMVSNRLYRVTFRGKRFGFLKDDSGIGHIYEIKG